MAKVDRELTGYTDNPSLIPGQGLEFYHQLFHILRTRYSLLRYSSPKFMEE